MVVGDCLVLRVAIYVAKICALFCFALKARVAQSGDLFHRGGAGDDLQQTFLVQVMLMSTVGLD
jgi:hypothetical protein